MSTTASVNACEEDEDSLRTVEELSDVRSFTLPRESLDKAHKDVKGRTFSQDFGVGWASYAVHCQEHYSEEW